MTHSKLPWAITEPNARGPRKIIAGDGSTVANLTILDMANAELIVKAVNAYDELVRLLERTKNQMDADFGTEYPLGLHADIAVTLNKLNKE